MSAQEPPVPLAIANDFTLSDPATRTSEQHARTSLGELRRSLEHPVVTMAPTSIIARRTLGIILLMFTVVLWTASNFLASVC